MVKSIISKNILKIAKSYLGNDIRIRNPLAWIHPATSLTKEIRSQKWHRDQEDLKMLKVFILFSNVNENNGPTQYVKSTNSNGRFKNIALLFPSAGIKADQLAVELSCLTFTNSGAPVKP